MSGYGFALGVSALLVATLFWLLRARRLREKYSAIWLVLVLGVCLIGAVPGFVFWLASVVGVETPVNLLLIGASVVLLVVCIQLSIEVSNLEEETRTIAEELALLRLTVERLAHQEPAGQRLAHPEPAVERLAQPEPVVERLAHPELAVERLTHPDPADERLPPAGTARVGTRAAGAADDDPER